MESRKILANEIEKHFSRDSRLFAFYADFLIFAGETNKAMSVLKENINKYPDYSTGELILGELFLKQNKADQAEMLFKGALEKDKTNVRALKIMAEISDSKGDKDAKLFYLREILKYDPLDQDARTILMLNESDDIVFDGRSGSFDEEDLEEEKKAAEASKSDEDAEETLSKLDSSPDIEIPEIPIAEDDDVFIKHKFGEMALDKEKSFSEDIIESLDTLTESFIDEPDEKEKDEPEESSYEDIVSFKKEEESEVKPEDILNIDYKDEDPEINEILKELTLTSEEYKNKMDSANKLVDEDNENYDYLVDLAYAQFRYAAFSIKKEILYYFKMTKEEPRNYKYAEKLKSFREEILKLKDDLIEQLNVLKNEYY